MGHGHELRYVGTDVDGAKQGTTPRKTGPAEASSENSQRNCSSSSGQPAQFLGSPLEPLHLAVDQYLSTEPGKAGGRWAGRIHETVWELKQFLGAAAELPARQPLPVPLTCDECPFVALSQRISDAGPARTGPGAPQVTASDQPPAGCT